MPELAFGKPKKTFTEAPIYMYFNPANRIILQMDACGLPIASILNQYDCCGILRLVNINSQKCSPTEQNYDTYHRDIFAFLETLRQLRHSLERANHKILIQCDHKNVRYFQM